jgi:hypothetical protein
MPDAPPSGAFLLEQLECGLLLVGAAAGHLIKCVGPDQHGGMGCARRMEKGLEEGRIAAAIRRGRHDCGRGKTP